MPNLRIVTGLDISPDVENTTLVVICAKNSNILLIINQCGTLTTANSELYIVRGSVIVHKAFHTLTLHCKKKTTKLVIGTQLRAVKASHQ